MEKRFNKIEKEQQQQGKDIATLTQIAADFSGFTKKMSSRLDDLYQVVMEQKAILTVIADFRRHVETDIRSVKDWQTEHEKLHKAFIEEYGAFLQGGKKLKERITSTITDTFLKIFFWVVITVVILAYAANKF